VLRMRNGTYRRERDIIFFKTRGGGGAFLLYGRKVLDAISPLLGEETYPFYKREKSTLRSV